MSYRDMWQTLQQLRQELANLEQGQAGERGIVRGIEHREADSAPSPSPSALSSASPVDGELTAEWAENEQPVVQGSSSSYHLAVNGSVKGAVQGMMWAEIFGPPRAKRPHRNKG